MTISGKIQYFCCERLMNGNRKPKYLLVMAGGSGTRMGASVPKQFLELRGKAILQMTIEKFMDAEPDIKVITVLPEPYAEAWRAYCSERSFLCPQRLVRGGFTRFHSVRNGLEHVPDGAIVAVHDGVRPLISSDLIREMFSMAENAPAVIPVIPCVDTMKVLKKDPRSGALTAVDGMTVDRSLLYAAQTPQMFSSELLKEAYRQAYDTSFTDDASVAAAAKIPLSYVAGERFNIKITTPEDLALAGAVMSLSRGL